jgi:hypothetical protein
MGDGKIYGRMREQTEIRCQDCHGTADQSPKTMVLKDSPYGTYAPSVLKIKGSRGEDRVVLNSRGNPLIHVKKSREALVLTGKISGKNHRIPLLTGQTGPHRFPGHNRLECYACHTSWAPRCYGCHEFRDPSRQQTDHLTRIKTPGAWQESRDYYRFENPALGWNTKGLVSPYIPGCQVLVTHLSLPGTREGSFQRRVFQGKSPINGIVSAPTFPHTVRREVPSCEDCHLNPQRWGVGEAWVDPQRNGNPLRFSWDSLITKEGRPLAGNAHPKARFFNGEDLVRIQRVGPCLACHPRYDDPIYRDFKKSLLLDRSDQHRAIVRRALRKDQER